MKTFQEFIKEKWVADVAKRNTVCPIYENPSSKDLIDLRKSGLVNDSVRFAAILSKKNLYVWSGMDMIHDVALAKLTKEKIIPKTQHDNLEQALCGECKIINGRLSFEQNDGMDTYFGAVIHSMKGRVKSNLDSSFLPLPYYEFKEMIDDLPDLIERYRWVERYIDEYDTMSSPALVLKLFKG